MHKRGGDIRWLRRTKNPKVNGSKMNYKNFKLKTPDGTEIVCYKWEHEKPTFAFQIIHGMMDHSGRYERLAQFLNKNGAVIYSEDHIGHGKTAKSISDIGHMADKDGLIKATEHIIFFNQYIKSKHPDLPVVVLGLSMGSTMARLALMNDKKFGDLVILAAASGKPGIKETFGLGVVRILKLFGSKKRNASFNKSVIDNMNKSFTPGKTAFDAFSRDEERVKDYLSDPFGIKIVPTMQYFYDLLSAVSYVNKKKNILNSDLSRPLLLISGSMDPVGEFGKGISKLYNDLKLYGVKDIELKLYEGARHGILDEINYQEVHDDILTWITQRIN